MTARMEAHLPGWLPPPSITAILLAPFMGSFLGVLVRRLPDGRPVALGRSACESCGHVLGARDLVPFASYLWLRGRCRFCAAPIAPAHFAIEAASLAIAIVAALVDGPDETRVWAGCALGWTLLALAWIDWTHMRLPDALTLPLVPVGLAATWVLDPDAIADHAAAAALGYLAFRLIAAAYRWRRKREGLGQGDAKLLAAAGAWVGLSGLPDVMLGGAIIGLAVAGARWLRGERVGADTALPFGPCLAAATWLVWLGVRLA